MLGAPSCPQSPPGFGPVPCAEPLGRRAGDKLCGDKLWHSHISLSAGDMDVGAGRGLGERSCPALHPAFGASHRGAAVRLQTGETLREPLPK